MVRHLMVRGSTIVLDLALHLAAASGLLLALQAFGTWLSMGASGPRRGSRSGLKH